MLKHRFLRGRSKDAFVEQLLKRIPLVSESNNSVFTAVNRDVESVLNSSVLKNNLDTQLISNHSICDNDNIKGEVHEQHTDYSNKNDSESIYKTAYNIKQSNENSSTEYVPGTTWIFDTEDNLNAFDPGVDRNNDMSEKLDKYQDNIRILKDGGEFFSSTRNQSNTRVKLNIEVLPGLSSSGQAIVRISSSTSENDTRAYRYHTNKNVSVAISNSNNVGNKVFNNDSNIASSSQFKIDTDSVNNTDNDIDEFLNDFEKESATLKPSEISVTQESNIVEDDDPQFFMDEFQSIIISEERV